MIIRKKDEAASRKRLEAYAEKIGSAISKHEGATEAFFVDEETVDVEEAQILAGGCEDYSQLEEMWFAVKDEKELPDSQKEEWIGFTYLLAKGAVDERAREDILRGLKKDGRLLLANAVETFLRAEAER